MIRKSLLLALAGVLATNLAALANIENGSYTPGTGGFTFTSPESPLPEDRAPTSYDVKVCYNIPDPSAKLYITRKFHANGAQGQVITQTVINFGSISMGQQPKVLDLGNFTPLSQGPGVETWSVCYGPANQKTPPTCIDTSSSDTLTVYPNVNADISNALILGNQSTAVNLATFHGGAPRINVQIINAVPGGTTWVAVYAGSVQTASTSIPAVGNTAWVNVTGSYYPLRTVTLDLGNCLPKDNGTYTVQVLQSSDYGTETLAAATFTLTGFKFNGTVGLSN